MKILGISCYFHDAAACLVEDGKIVFAAQEERFSRKKNDAAFPKKAIEACLQMARITPSELDAVVYYEKPLLKFDRILQSHISAWPKSIHLFITTMEQWIGKKMRIRKHIQSNLAGAKQILFTKHHDSHAGAAFYGSKFPRATVITLDGVGEWATTSVFLGDGNKLEPLREILFPNSLGLFYSAFTDFLGFEVNDGEYKVMGLAPYGKPNYLKELADYISLFEDGSFQLNMDRFVFDRCKYMLDWKKTEKKLGISRREPQEPINQQHKDLASTIQVILQKAVLQLVTNAVNLTGERRVCLAGGVALNCVANGHLLREAGLEDLFVFPAAGDAGGAVGSALIAYYQLSNRPRDFNTFNNTYLGPEFSQKEIDGYLQRSEIPHINLSDTDLFRTVAKLLQDQFVVGWFQGRLEFGPRALGNRSIIADPRYRVNWDRVNFKIKYREDFRPLAPSVMAEFSHQFFDLDRASPYMTFVCNEISGKLPAVTHVDGTARLQTVSYDQNPRFYQLLKEFHCLSGVPVLINTSFNTSNMPIVCSPQNAFQCFLETDLDAMVLGNSLVLRNQIDFLNRKRLNC